MKFIRNNILVIISFMTIISLFSISSFLLMTGSEIEDFHTIVLIASFIILINLILSILIKKISYFIFAISILILSGSISVLLNSPIGELFLGNTIAAMYIGFFIMAFLPQLIGLKPFSYYISKNNFPEAIVKSDQFMKINSLVSFIWATIFLVSFILTIVSYSDDYVIQQIIQNTLPIIIQLTIGIYVSTKLPIILIQKIPAERIKFDTVKEMFQTMPLGLNKARAKEINTIIQFNLSGDEDITGYLTIKDQQCTYTDGVSENPDTTIISDSKLWLGISNGDIDGNKAYLNKEYTVMGEAEILLQLDKLFAPPEQRKITKKKDLKKSETASFSYEKLKPGKIKNIVVINGSLRNTKFSKSLFMANSFIDGAKKAGASVEMIDLKEKDINYCTGCYTCWTKTPGVCIHKDDMPELLVKYRKADLIIFVSPLYVFSVSAKLKVFIDRLLPILQPYMRNNEEHTYHPPRYEEDPEQGLIIFSAGGFPDIDHNFDGISAIMRNMGSHFSKSLLMGEFFLPAAEMICQPVYKSRKERIQKNCFDAGFDSVTKGEIKQEYMDIVADPGVDTETFGEQANNYWSSLDGKMSYYKGTPELKYKTEET